VKQGDITTEKVDAIVNAANAQLMHGGGLAAAIVRRGGEIIQTESDEWVKQHGAVGHDQPALTGAGRLACQYVMHAVGPIWGSGEEDAKLASAIQGCLALAEAMGLRSLALPAISTGIFGFPVERAAGIFMQVIDDFVTKSKPTRLKTVRITIIDQSTFSIFLRTFNSHFYDHIGS